MTNNFIRSHQKDFVIAGLIVIIFGLLAVLAPMISGPSFVLMLGVLVSGAGAARMYWAVKMHRLQKSSQLLAMGGLTFATGIFMIIHPVAASKALSIIITLYFILDGISEVYAANLLRPKKGWLVMTFGGAVSIILGLLFWAQIPLAGAWATAIYMGIKLFCVGLIVLFSLNHLPGTVKSDEA